MDKKINFVFVALIGMISLNCFAETIPDPTVQIATPPVGLPGGTSGLPTNMVAETIKHVYLEPMLQGVMVSEELIKDTDSRNQAFINGGVYRVNDVVGEKWKVKSIARKKVVLVNIESKQVKTLYISGE